MWFWILGGGVALIGLVLMLLSLTAGPSDFETSGYLEYGPDDEGNTREIR